MFLCSISSLVLVSAAHKVFGEREVGHPKQLAMLICLVAKNQYDALESCLP